MSKPSGKCPPPAADNPARHRRLVAPVSRGEDERGGVGGVVQNLDVDWLGLRGGGGLLAGAGVTEVARVRAGGHLESDAVSGCEPMADWP